MSAENPAALIMVEFSPELSQQQREMFLKCLEDYFKACGGKSFKVEWEEAKCPK